ncbi:hypothetical protein [Algoriphagus pacificus]|uniref:DUF4145 domain-containing protein n=1 Tax=Algoriphagus pacificus TaxID=2811234 RepID=A0ABS3CCH9_9BACT|nr:hypothetical protein [Algoriphagus pacificus]MBN7814244.1 hypothetical protein [Algoriphagus pacificus]
MSEENNLNKIRGQVIDKTNQIETILSTSLFNHFEPKKNQFQFKFILLDTQLINLGSKIKILHSLGLINNSDKNLLHEIINLRNIFAHAPTYDSAHWQSESEESEYLIKIGNSKTLPVMKKGEIIFHDPEELLSEFNEKVDKINPTLEKLNSKS